MKVPVPLHALAAVALLAGCAATADLPTDRAALYRAAVEDAAVAADDEVAELRPVSGATATMVTWSKYYDAPGPVVLDHGAVWVTQSPQVQEICRALPDGTTQARMEELLGLPPGGGDGRRFVVMTVRTEDMFRPCPDPRIDQPRCPISLPGAPPPGVDEATWQADMDFLLGQMLSSYRTTDGYPFTRLGYTYDWSPSSADNVGASEYVVRKGATVVIGDIVPTEVYCAPPPA